MNKNDVYEIRIDDISEDGSGIGHVDGMAVFVKDTLTKDVAEVKIIKVKKSYAYGRLMKLIHPSPDRREAACPIARQCGGCTLQHMDYEAQLRYKIGKVENCLKRIGGIENPEELFEEMLGMEENPFRFRNKMQFPIGTDKEGKAVLGFYAQRTHSIIPVGDCMTGHKVNSYIIDAVKKYIDDNRVSIYDEEKGTGLLRHLITRTGFSTGELMVALVINGDDIPKREAFIRALEEAVERYGGELSLTSVMLNFNKEKTNRIIGFESKAIYGRDFIYDYIGDVKFRISVESFFQVNPYQTGRLYGKALEYAGLTGEETVWDMYCGIGTISLFLSKQAGKVYGVEIVPQAIEDAKRNAELNEISNTEFYVGKAEDVVTDIYAAGQEGSHADVVVVDPPRKGCDAKLLDTLILMKPKRIVYVSCDPATLARDIKILSESGGYKLEKYSVCDMFSHSGHVECVSLLQRMSNTRERTITLDVEMEDYHRIKNEGR